jgi:MFS family permease
MATAAAMEKNNSGDLRDLPSEFLPASEASQSAFTELKTPESEPSQSDSKVWEDGLPLETLESTVEPMKPAEDVQEPESVRSWFVLLATFTAMLFSYGISFSSGIWQRYFYSTEYFGPQSQKTLAWIGSIAYAFSTASGMVVGPASDYFGHQKMLGVGTVLFSLSWLLSSFANSVYILYITQGAMLGVSLACLLIPSGGVLVTYWTRRRALAISLAGTGGGFGGFLWPPVIQALLDKIGVVWTYRTMALISIIVLGLCTAVLRPAGAPKKVDRKANFIDPAFFSSRHYWLLSGVGFAITTGYYLPTYYFPQ